MNSRYQKLFTLPGELYAREAPLMIVAGALLKDTALSRLVAQLKLKNLGDKPVIAVKARLYPLDPAGRPAGDPVDYPYMDLQAKKGETFGSQNPILISSPVARSFRAELLEAIFEDGSLWTAPEGLSWESLPAPLPLLEALGDEELLKQLRLARGENCRYLPARYGDLLRCTCGELTRDEKCPVCRKGYFEPNLPALTMARDLRLAEEGAARARAEAEALREAERKQAARKKALFLGIGIPVLALLITAFFLLGLPGIRTLQAKAALRSQDYVRAVELYRDAAGYRLYNSLFHADQMAQKHTPAARYQEGAEAAAEGRFEDALAAFEAAGDYQDAGEQILRVWLLRGDAAAEEGRWIDAVACYTQAGSYGDAEARIADCTPGVVKEAAMAGDLEMAELYYAKIEKSAETKLLRGELELYLARAYALAGKPGKASSLLNSAKYDKDDESLAELADEARYYAAVAFMEDGQYLASAAAFRSLADYRDSAHLEQSARLGYLNQSFEQGQYRFLASRAEEIDKSLLSGEELESYQNTLYSAARQLENSGEYADAFTLYRLSGKGDYQSRMDACNRKYIQIPFVFSNTIYSSGGKVKITGVSALYHNGVVTFTVSYSCSTNFNLYFYQSGTRKLAKSLNAGTSSFTFDIDYSSLLESSNLSVDLFQYAYSGASSSMSLSMDSIRKLASDLYGNPIP